jgi:cytochrome c553
MNKWILPLSIALAVSAGMALAAGNAEAEPAKVAICAGCHGPDGNSVNPAWPKLAGQHESYIVAQLKALKAGKTRTDPLMSAQAATLSEQDMTELAAYFSSQTRSLGTTAPDKLEKGQKLYRGGNPVSGVAACIGCHGPAGSGNPTAGFPSLAGQHAAYVTKALNDFKDNKRTTDPNHMMRDVAGKLSDKEIAAVAEYVQGLRAR